MSLEIQGSKAQRGVWRGGAGVAGSGGLHGSLPPEPPEPPVGWEGVSLEQEARARIAARTAGRGGIGPVMIDQIGLGLGLGLGLGGRRAQAARMQSAGVTTM